MVNFQTLEMQANHIERLQTKLNETFGELTDRFRKCKGWVEYLASKSPEPSMYEIEFKKKYVIPEDADETYEIKDVIFRIDVAKQCILQVGPSSTSSWQSINDENSEFQTIFVEYAVIEKFLETGETA